MKRLISTLIFISLSMVYSAGICAPLNAQQVNNNTNILAAQKQSDIISAMGYLENTHNCNGCIVNQVGNENSALIIQCDNCDSGNNVAYSCSKNDKWNCAQINVTAAQNTSANNKGITAKCTKNTQQQSVNG